MFITFLQKIIVSFLKAICLLIAISLFVSDNVKDSTFNSVSVLILVMLAVWDWKYE